jgi:hypothetical protein
MNDHQKHTEFLKQCLRYEESGRRRELEKEITRIQHDERCVRRASWFMVVLICFALTGLIYPAILLGNFPFSVPQIIVNFICTLGVGSLLSLLAFACLGAACRMKLDRRREECRQVVARLLESRSRNPAAAPCQEPPSDGDTGSGAAPGADGGNGSPAGIESAAHG